MSTPLTGSFPDPPYAIRNARLWGTGGSAESFLVTRTGGFFPRGDGASDSRLPAVEADGAWLLPGFFDVHVHVRATASARLSIDISDLADSEQILRSVRAESARHVGGWLSLWGLGSGAHTGHSVTADDLESASGGRLVRIRHRSSHAWIFSRSALDALGIGSREAAPSGLHVEVGEDGVPTGFVVDHGGWLRDRMARVTTPSTLRAEVRRWSREMAAQGVIGLVDATVTNGGAAVEELGSWAADGTIVQRVGVMTGALHVHVPEPLHFAGRKVMPPFEPELSQVLLETWSSGTSVAIHCVTTDELASIIEAVESVPEERRGRLRIEHASVCPPEWLERVALLRPTIVTHPGFIAAHGDRYLRDASLIPHEWLYRLGSWEQQGVDLVFASDSPAGPTDPLLQIRAALTRRTASGQQFVGNGEAMPAAASLAALTTRAASAGGFPRSFQRGLGTGAPANLVVVAMGPGGLVDPSNEVVATILDGRAIS